MTKNMPLVTSGLYIFFYTVKVIAMGSNDEFCSQITSVYTTQSKYSTIKNELNL